MLLGVTRFQLLMVVAHVQVAGLRGSCNLTTHHTMITLALPAPYMRIRLMGLGRTGRRPAAKQAVLTHGSQARPAGAHAVGRHHHCHHTQVSARHRRLSLPRHRWGGPSRLTALWWGQRHLAAPHERHPCSTPAPAESTAHKAHTPGYGGAGHRARPATPGWLGLVCQHRAVPSRTGPYRSGMGGPNKDQWSRDPEDDSSTRPPGVHHSCEEAGAGVPSATPSLPAARGCGNRGICRVTMASFARNSNRTRLLPQSRSPHCRPETSWGHTLSLAITADRHLADPQP